MVQMDEGNLQSDILMNLGFNDATVIDFVEIIMTEFEINWSGDYNYFLHLNSEDIALIVYKKKLKVH